MSLTSESSEEAVRAYFESKGLSAPLVDGGTLFGCTRADLSTYSDGLKIYRLVKKLKQREAIRGLFSAMGQLQEHNNQLQNYSDLLEDDNNRLQEQLNDVVNSFILFCLF